MDSIRRQELKDFLERHLVRRLSLFNLRQKQNINAEHSIIFTSPNGCTNRDPFVKFDYYLGQLHLRCEVRHIQYSKWRESDTGERYVVNIKQQNCILFTLPQDYTTDQILNAVRYMEDWCAVMTELLEFQYTRIEDQPPYDFLNFKRHPLSLKKAWADYVKALRQKSRLGKYYPSGYTKLNAFRTGKLLDHRWGEADFNNTEHEGEAQKIAHRFQLKMHSSYRRLNS